MAECHNHLRLLHSQDGESLISSCKHGLADIDLEDSALRDPVKLTECKRFRSERPGVVTLVFVTVRREHHNLTRFHEPRRDEHSVIAYDAIVKMRLTIIDSWCSVHFLYSFGENTRGSTCL